MRAEIGRDGYHVDRECEHCNMLITKDKCRCGDNQDRYLLTMREYQRNMNFESQWLEVAATRHFETPTGDTAGELKKALEEWLWSRRRARGG